jgi:SAM-dependent methyltransferase
VSTWDKYGPGAERWSDEAYADSRTYLARRAELVRTLGPRLEPGDTVVDLACGDGGFGEFLPEQRYVGVDGSAEMVAAGKRRGRDLVHGDLNDYTPPQPVAATTIFRAIYYARDRRALLERIAGYTEKKLVFDLNPRQYRVEDMRADLLASGFEHIALRPFFVPQTRALPRPLSLVMRLLEQSGPPARVLLRARFTYFVAAWGTKR